MSQSRLTKNEKITLIISVLAILLSLLQFIFSIPYFTDFFFKPEIIGFQSKVEVLEKKSINVYDIKNIGNRSAENLLISLKCGKNDIVSVLPQIDSDVKLKNNGEPIKDVIINIRKLLPNEKIVLLIQIDSATTNINKVSNMKFPFVETIKYDDGFGKLLN